MSLKQVFEPYFKIGAAVPAFGFKNPKVREAVRTQYNSLTCENAMKPERVLDREKNMSDPEKYRLAPALDFSEAKATLDFAKDNGIPMRGHTLVWHNQTPKWFFHENFDESAPLAGREEMILRLESYIREVLTWVQTNYPGLIYAWDVANEVILENGIRESLWTKTLGEDYAIWAFRFARKYVASGVSLFYNDYDTFSPWKRDLIVERVLKPLLAEGLVDGMGMQGHMTLRDINLNNFKDSLETFGALVKEVQVTELDIHTVVTFKETHQDLAQVYAMLFAMLIRAKKEGKANITNVTFWGLNDEYTWLTYFRKERSFPLLFDEVWQPKPAYWAVVNVPGKLEGDVADRLPHGQRFAFWEKDVKVVKELHVDCNAANASDENDGSAEAPFATIQAAADAAQPGTRVLIHGGVYRECVCPRMGGTDAENMIIYEAFEGEEVIVKASEIAEPAVPSEGWSLRGKETEGLTIWETKINPNKFLGYNPFNAVNILHDRLFIEYEKTDMLTYLNRRGMVFC
ncbi:MAG: endo-1,4-beta-xylanase, partial [Clostridiales bacterium]|nr:endo-1,4-beta-xylanase [Candidatus Blautia equi]